MPSGASEQVRSVCNRFALVAAAGSLATALGLTGWPDDEADRAAAVCFKAWLANRGSHGDHEIEAGIRQVVAFVEAHGSSRFESAWETHPDQRVHNRVGFREHEFVNGEMEGRWRYYVLPAMWRQEIAKGFDGAALVKAMTERGLVIPDDSGRPAMQKKIPNHGNKRVYALAPALFEDKDGGDAC